MFTGPDLYYESAGRVTPKGVTIVEGILVGIFGVLMIIGLGYQWSLRQKRKKGISGREKGPEFKQVSSA